MMLDFFTSPIGLGHATRDIAIASCFEKFSGQFITGGGAAKIISNYGFDVKDLYTAPRFKVNNGLLEHSANWLWKYYKYYKDCKKISQKIIQENNPRLVVSDEDFASLTVSQEKKIPTVLITDILETRFTSGFFSVIERQMNKSMKKIIEKCDVVILPEFGDNESNIQRVGPIIRQTKETRENLRKKFEFTKKTILVSIGGTDAGMFLIEKTIDAVKKINQDTELVLVAGPTLEKKYGVRNLGFVNNLHELIFAADVLVALAGKSTIDEATAYGTPSIFIPIKHHFEQEDNAREAGFEFDDVNRLDILISKKLEEKRNPVSLNGAQKAHDIIKDLI